ncbi:aminoglycoside phosphotransferase family protein [Streptomyces sp. NBRC 109706]|uniref:aminoglycoside phosphotransferase family protein n=1 Tax=Streptomyces sp. NBRC 109706 TaxID=1550035 RepID=UPI00099CF1B8|nr:aminoglycoside phosphotransferase family protein [Streptomyces sp. NBRC 109706]
MEISDVMRAKAAVISLAASLGLPVNDAIVLHNSNKLALRLTPADVFARVAPVGQEVARFEVDVAQRLAEVGSPVCSLEPRVEPDVYLCDGFVVTLWVYHEPVSGVLRSADYATALHQLHAGMRQVDLPSPRFTDRVTQAQEVVARPDRSPELAETDRVFLAATLAGLRHMIEERGAAEQLLHGEPHPGNVLNTGEGPLFIDFETCCRGPVEFDLAHVPEAVCAYYPNIDQDLLEDCRHLVLAVVAAWRWELDDEFPHRDFFRVAFLRVLREGPPWPTLDVVNARLTAS